jgi:hypothetical protein
MRTFADTAARPDARCDQNGFCKDGEHGRQCAAGTGDRATDSRHWGGFAGARPARSVGLDQPRQRVLVLLQQPHQTPLFEPARQLDHAADLHASALERFVSASVRVIAVLAVVSGDPMRPARDSRADTFQDLRIQSLHRSDPVLFVRRFGG